MNNRHVIITASKSDNTGYRLQFVNGEGTLIGDMEVSSLVKSKFVIQGWIRYGKYPSSPKEHSK